jgi:hypothetical protein
LWASGIRIKMAIKVRTKVVENNTKCSRIKDPLNKSN